MSNQNVFGSCPEDPNDSSGREHNNSTIIRPGCISNDTTGHHISTHIDECDENGNKHTPKNLSHRQTSLKRKDSIVGNSPFVQHDTKEGHTYNIASPKDIGLYFNANKPETLPTGDASSPITSTDHHKNKNPEDKDHPNTSPTHIPTNLDHHQHPHHFKTHHPTSYSNHLQNDDPKPTVASWEERRRHDNQPRREETNSNSDVVSSNQTDNALEDDDVFRNDVFRNDVFRNDVFRNDVFRNDVFRNDVFNPPVTGTATHYCQQDSDANPSGEKLGDSNSNPNDSTSSIAKSQTPSSKDATRRTSSGVPPRSSKSLQRSQSLVDTGLSASTKRPPVCELVRKLSDVSGNRTSDPQNKENKAKNEIRLARKGSLRRDSNPIATIQGLISKFSPVQQQHVATCPETADSIIHTTTHTSHDTSLNHVTKPPIPPVVGNNKQRPSSDGTSPSTATTCNDSRQNTSSRNAEDAGKINCYHSESKTIDDNNHQEFPGRQLDNGDRQNPTENSNVESSRSKEITKSSSHKFSRLLQTYGFAGVGGTYDNIIKQPTNVRKDGEGKATWGQTVNGILEQETALAAEINNNNNNNNNKNSHNNGEGDETVTDDNSMAIDEAEIERLLEQSVLRRRSKQNFKTSLLDRSSSLGHIETNYKGNDYVQRVNIAHENSVEDNKYQTDHTKNPNGREMQPSDPEAVDEVNKNRIDNPGNKKKEESMSSPKGNSTLSDVTSVQNNYFDHIQPADEDGMYSQIGQDRHLNNPQHKNNISPNVYQELSPDTRNYKLQTNENCSYNEDTEPRDVLSQRERIALYKEERRKQMASISRHFGSMPTDNRENDDTVNSDIRDLDKTEMDSLVDNQVASIGAQSRTEDQPVEEDHHYDMLGERVPIGDDECFPWGYEMDGNQSSNYKSNIQFERRQQKQQQQQQQQRSKVTSSTHEPYKVNVVIRSPSNVTIGYDNCSRAGRKSLTSYSSVKQTGGSQMQEVVVEKRTNLSRPKHVRKPPEAESYGHGDKPITALPHKEIEESIDPKQKETKPKKIGITSPVPQGFKSFTELHRHKKRQMVASINNPLQHSLSSKRLSSSNEVGTLETALKPTEVQTTNHTAVKYKPKAEDSGHPAKRPSFYVPLKCSGTFVKPQPKQTSPRRIGSRDFKRPLPKPAAGNAFDYTDNNVRRRRERSNTMPQLNSSPFKCKVYGPCGQQAANNNRQDGPFGEPRNRHDNIDLAQPGDVKMMRSDGADNTSNISFSLATLDADQSDILKNDMHSPNGKGGFHAEDILPFNNPHVKDNVLDHQEEKNANAQSETPAVLEDDNMQDRSLCSNKSNPPNNTVPTKQTGSIGEISRRLSVFDTVSPANPMSRSHKHKMIKKKEDAAIARFQKYITQRKQSTFVVASSNQPTVPEVTELRLCDVELANSPNSDQSESPPSNHIIMSKENESHMSPERLAYHPGLISNDYQSKPDPEKRIFSRFGSSRETQEPARKSTGCVNLINLNGGRGQPKNGDEILEEQIPLPDKVRRCSFIPMVCVPLETENRRTAENEPNHITKTCSEGNTNPCLNIHRVTEILKSEICLEKEKEAVGDSKAVSIVLEPNEEGSLNNAKNIPTTQKTRDNYNTSMPESILSYPLPKQCKTIQQSLDEEHIQSNVAAENDHAIVVGTSEIYDSQQPITHDPLTKFGDINTNLMAGAPNPSLNKEEGNLPEVTCPMEVETSECKSRVSSHDKLNINYGCVQDECASFSVSGKLDLDPSRSQGEKESASDIKSFEKCVPSAIHNRIKDFMGTMTSETSDGDMKLAGRVDTTSQEKPISEKDRLISATVSDKIRVFTGQYSVLTSAATIIPEEQISEKLKCSVPLGVNDTDETDSVTENNVKQNASYGLGWIKRQAQNIISYQLEEQDGANVCISNWGREESITKLSHGNDVDNTKQTFEGIKETKEMIQDDVLEAEPNAASTAADDDYDDNDKDDMCDMNDNDNDNIVPCKIFGNKTISSADEYTVNKNVHTGSDIVADQLPVLSKESSSSVTVISKKEETIDRESSSPTSFGVNPRLDYIKNAEEAAETHNKHYAADKASLKSPEEYSLKQNIISISSEIGLAENNTAKNSPPTEFHSSDTLQDITTLKANSQNCDSTSDRNAVKNPPIQYTEEPESVSCTPRLIPASIQLCETASPPLENNNIIGTVNSKMRNITTGTADDDREEEEKPVDVMSMGDTQSSLPDMKSEPGHTHVVPARISMYQESPLRVRLVEPGDRRVPRTSPRQERLMRKPSPLANFEDRWSLRKSESKFQKGTSPRCNKKVKTRVASKIAEKIKGFLNKTKSSTGQSHSHILSPDNSPEVTPPGKSPSRFSASGFSPVDENDIRFKSKTFLDGGNDKIMRDEPPVRDIKAVINVFERQGLCEKRPDDSVSLSTFEMKRDNKEPFRSTTSAMKRTASSASMIGKKLMMNLQGSEFGGGWTEATETEREAGCGDTNNSTITEICREGRGQEFESGVVLRQKRDRNEQLIRNYEEVKDFHARNDNQSGNSTISAFDDEATVSLVDPKDVRLSEGSVHSPYTNDKSDNNALPIKSYDELSENRRDYSQLTTTHYDLYNVPEGSQKDSYAQVESETNSSVHVPDPGPLLEETINTEQLSPEARPQISYNHVIFRGTDRESEISTHLHRSHSLQGKPSKMCASKLADEFILNLDVSQDSFNMLFIENAMYLKDGEDYVRGGSDEGVSPYSRRKSMGYFKKGGGKSRDHARKNNYYKRSDAGLASGVDDSGCHSRHHDDNSDDKDDKNDDIVKDSDSEDENDNDDDDDDNDDDDEEDNGIDGDDCEEDENESSVDQQHQKSSTSASIKVKTKKEKKMEARSRRRNLVRSSGISGDDAFISTTSEPLASTRNTSWRDKVYKDTPASNSNDRDTNNKPTRSDSSDLNLNRGKREEGGYSRGVHIASRSSRRERREGAELREQQETSAFSNSARRTSWRDKVYSGSNESSSVDKASKMNDDNSDNENNNNYNNSNDVDNTHNNDNDSINISTGGLGIGYNRRRSSRLINEEGNFSGSSDSGVSGGGRRGSRRQSEENVSSAIAERLAKRRASRLEEQASSSLEIADSAAQNSASLHVERNRNIVDINDANNDKKRMSNFQSARSTKASGGGDDLGNSIVTPGSTADPARVESSMSLGSFDDTKSSGTKISDMVSGFGARLKKLRGVEEEDNDNIAGETKQIKPMGNNSSSSIKPPSNSMDYPPCIVTPDSVSHEGDDNDNRKNGSTPSPSQDEKVKVALQRKKKKDKSSSRKSLLNTTQSSDEEEEDNLVTKVRKNKTSKLDKVCDGERKGQSLEDDAMISKRRNNGEYDNIGNDNADDEEYKGGDEDSDGDNGSDNSKRSTDMKTEDRLRKRGDGSTSSFVSQHALLWENHAHSTATSSAHSSRPKFDYYTRSLGGLSEKINANRLKFDQNNTNISSSSSSSPSSSATSSTPSTNTTSSSSSSTSSSAPSVKKIHRGRTDFGQLLQKFSGSEVSGSEKSDNENGSSNSSLSRSQSHHVQGSAPPRLNVLRQSLERGSTSGSDVDSRSPGNLRRTPERSQSLSVKLSSSGKSEDRDEKKVTSYSNDAPSERKPTTISSPREDGVNAGEKTPSTYKSDFMARKMSGGLIKSDRSGDSGAEDGVSKTSSSRIANARSGTESRSGSGSESESGGKQSQYQRLRNQFVSDLKSSTAGVSANSPSSSSATGCKVLDSSSNSENGLSSELETNTSSVLSNDKNPNPISSISGKQKSHSPASSIARRSPLRQDSKDLSRRSWHKESSPSLQSTSTTKLSSSQSSILPASSSSLLSTSSTSSPSISKIDNVSSIDKEDTTSSQFTTTSLSSSTSTPCIASSISSPSLSSSTGAISTDAISSKDSAATSTDAISSKDSAATTCQSFQSANNTNPNIRRAFSFKDVTAEHSENSETRRGILKRATSLTKRDVGSSPSGQILDPQLAKILQQRRQIQGDVKEEDEEEEQEEDVRAGSSESNVVKRRSRALSAAEEIEENLKYSKEKAAERGIDPEEDETFKRRSVADRIFFMQAKIEEVKQGSSSGSRSGVSTPRSRPRSGPITPTQQRSLDEALYLSTLSPRSPPPPHTTLSSSTSPVISRSPCSPSRTFSTLTSSAAPPESKTSSSTVKSCSVVTDDSEDKKSTTSSKANNSARNRYPIPVSSSSFDDSSPRLRSQLNFDDDDDNKYNNNNDEQRPITSSSSSSKISSSASVTNGKSDAGNDSRKLERTTTTTSSSSSSIIPKLELSGIAESSNSSGSKTGNGNGNAGKDGKMAVSGDQLMQKLSEIADANEAYEERRQRFQQRPKDDWRHRTQPVTLEEIQAADRLETVASFRALIRKETSTGIFKKIQQECDVTSKPLTQTSSSKSAKGKGSDEFPQHLAPSSKHQRRSRKSRYNTLPVTAEELKAVPENTELGTESDWDSYEVDVLFADLGIEMDDSLDVDISAEYINSLRGAMEYVQALRADSGIELAASDVDISNEYANSLRSLTLEMEVDESDPAALSVSAKTGMFKAIDDKKNKSASGAKRYINRKKRERSQTMPITDEEVKTAAEEQASATGTSANNTAASRVRAGVQRQPEIVNRSKSVDESHYNQGDAAGDEDDPENDQLTKLSLSEKVKLFSQPKQVEKTVTKAEAPVVRRRNRKQASRFNTQPVTTEEVEKAAAYTRISPLAMSMVKPPDPELLKGLPLKDQRQLMAAHAEMCLSQSSSRSQSRSGSIANLESSQNSSRRSSTDASGTEKDATSQSTKSILKDSSKDLAQEIQGILKPTETNTTQSTSSSSSSSSASSSGNPSSKSILKIKSEENRVESSTTSDEEDHKSILKSKTLSESEDNTERDLSTQQHSGHRSRSDSQPSGILKNDEHNNGTSTSSALSSTSNSSPKPTRGILKSSSQEKVDAEANVAPAMKSALRRGSSDVDECSVSSASLSSSLKSALKSSNSSSSLEENKNDIGDDIIVKESAKSVHSSVIGEASSSLESSGMEGKSGEISNVSEHLSGINISNNNDVVKDKSDNVGYVDNVVKGSAYENKKDANDVDGIDKSLPGEVNSEDTVDGSKTDGNKETEPEMDESGSSSGELLEDTPRSRIKKKRFADRLAKNQRYKSQPADLTPSATTTTTTTTTDTIIEPSSTPSTEDSSLGTPETGEVTAVKKKYKYEGRHKTQPITEDEMRDAEANTPVKKDNAKSPGSSIAQRLNQLRTSGNEEWKKRVDKKDELVTAAEIVKKREKKAEGERPKSIADRLNEIEVAKMTWKGRVEESDAKQFTVAGKIGTSPGTPPASPLLGRRKPKTSTTTDLPACHQSTTTTTTIPASSKPSTSIHTTTTPATTTSTTVPPTPIKDAITRIPLPKEIVKDTNANTEPAAPTTTPSVKKADSFRTRVKVEDDSPGAQEVKVEVPQVGEDLDEFFHTKTLDEINKEKVEVDIGDFDTLAVDPQKILTNVRKARPARNTKSTSRNPLKAMAQTIEIKQEYTQQSHGVAEREFKRVKKENLAKDAGFAQAALAGLASKENFKSVELRRSDSNSLAHGQRLDPFNDLMLLQVKGRRSVQTRLVEPHTRSLNSGDCFILVTPEKIVQWEGQFANVIEKAKASEIAQIIQAKKDLGCKKASDVQMVTQSKDQYGPGKILWATLEGERQCQDCGPDTEDEVFESSMVRSNMVFRLEGNALIPYEEYWGVTLKHDMLKRNEVLVFDFGTEFYLWQGKGVSMEQRKLSLRLAKQLYDKGYDYSQAPINPVCPLRSPETGGLSLKADKRPKWAIFGKVNQNMETVLFREKFADWPDSSRLIQCRGHDSETPNKELQELKAYDATKMIPISRVPVTLKLEGADVGRGVKWSEDMQGFIKEQDIITLEVTAWHVLEYEHFKLPVSSHGQFHDGDTYVVRWQYMIANANLRSLKKGSTSSHNSLTGRERCAYFFWQGNQSTINEKGASALMTVELDEERGPQVRVLEGKEPPCFLNLFGGKMILHIGKREEPETNTQGPWRLYCLRGDYDNEMYLLEVPVYLDHLRSRSSMVLLNVDTGRTYIWHGVRSPSHVRKLCKKAVDNIQNNIPLELGMRSGVRMDVKEVEEGEEGGEIWGALGKKNRDKYHSLIMNPVPTCTKTLRLFHMSSVNMVFDVHEQLSPCRTTEFTSAFPFLQLDLYTAIQPALFLVDCHHSVYLWQGWWPTASKDHQNVHTGSATARFNMDRRLAMETALSYCKEKNPSDPPKAQTVCAGVEPLAFTTLFPYWIVNDAIRELALEDGKSPGYTEDVSTVLHRLTQTRYSLAELQERPLPEGVDPLKLETFLHDKDFEECLEMTREDFYTQPAWKQRQLKQLVGLF